MQAETTRLRPMSLSDILDAIFRLYRQNFLTFIGAVALLQVPMVMLQVGLVLTVGQGFASDMSELSRVLPFFDPATDSFADLPLSNFIAYMGLSLALALFQGFVVYQLIIGALANATSKTHLGQHVSILGAYDFGVGRMLSLVLAGILISLILGLLVSLPIGGIFLLLTALGGALDQGGAGVVFLLVVLIVGAIVVFGLLAAALGLFFLFVPQAIVIEDHNPLSALGRSFRLVWGSFGRTLGTVLVLWLLVSIISFLPSAILGGVVGFFFSDPVNDFAIRQSLSTLVGYVAQILVLPIQFIGYTLIYYDLRVRKEGYDMQLLVQDAGSAAPEASPTSI